MMRQMHHAFALAQETSIFDRDKICIVIQLEKRPVKVPAS